MSIVTDHRDFYGDFFQGYTCRGKNLINLLKEIKSNEIGKKHGNNLIGSLSSYSGTCKHHASADIDETPFNKTNWHPYSSIPAVFITDKKKLEEQGAFEVQYDDDEWLDKNPDIVDAIQGIDTFKKRKKNEKILTVKYYKPEHEVMARTEKLIIPKYSRLNIYLDSDHFKHFGVETHMWGYHGQEFADKMTLSVNKLKEFLKTELKQQLEDKTISDIRIYGCHSTLQINEEKESACVLLDLV